MQILHSGGNHWITMSTIGSTSPSTVQVYDSLGKGLPLETKKQITAILHSPDKEITNTSFFLWLTEDRSSLTSHIVVCLRLQIQWQYVMVNPPSFFTMTLGSIRLDHHDNYISDIPSSVWTDSSCK